MKQNKEEFSNSNVRTNLIESVSISVGNEVINTQWYCNRCNTIHSEYGLVYSDKEKENACNFHQIWNALTLPNEKRLPLYQPKTLKNICLNYIKDQSLPFDPSILPVELVNKIENYMM